jgi:hypothetical protein
VRLHHGRRLAGDLPEVTRLWLVPSVAVLLLAAAMLPAQPRVVPRAEWNAAPPLGVSADAARRNKKAGDSLAFRGLTVTVQRTAVDSSTGSPVDVAQLLLRSGSARSERAVREGAAFNWEGFHIAVVAVYGPGELGAGLVALEVATLSSLPARVANSTLAGGAELRLRVPHQITHVTLHHTGDSKPLTRTDDPAQRLRNLQSWGARDRNWWDLPYHYLLDLDGRAFEGRDWRFQGETNTTYDPGGHFLISMIGNYDVQEPSPGQLEAIADLMAWALRENHLGIEAIGGHYQYAETGCPGRFLRPYIENGTLKRMVAERLARK